MKKEDVSTVFVGIRINRINKMKIELLAKKNLRSVSKEIERLIIEAK